MRGAVVYAKIFELCLVPKLGIHVRKSGIALNICRAVVLAAIFGMCTYLFYNQAIGEFYSDMPAHIKDALNPAADSYSFVKPFYKLVLESFGRMGFAVMLAIVETATVALTELVIRRLMPNMKPHVAFACAIACNFCIAVWLPFFNLNFVVGSPSASNWHNSTYIVMRLFGLATMLFLLKFDGVIEARSKVTSWIGFTVFLAVTTAIKPSCAIVLGPALFVYCIVDLVRNGTSTVKHSLLIALSLIITVAIVAYQYMVLFPSGGDSGGVAFGLARVWRHHNPNIFVSFFQSLAFPLLVLAACWRRLPDDRNFLLGGLMFAFALTEYVFLNETGARSMHGNFGWGTSFAMFYLFISCCVAFVQERGVALKLAVAKQDAPTDASAPGLVANDAEKAAASQPANAWRPLDIAVVVALGLHVLSGFIYFGHLLMGLKYY